MNAILRRRPVEVIKLSARKRTGSGKSYTRKARAAGWIPAVSYGHGKETVAIEIDAKEFASIVRKKQTTHLFDLGLGSDKETGAIIKEVQPHVIKRDTYLHVDFQQVNVNERVVIHCPVVLEGVAAGVKEGGILEHPVRELQIECMPHLIPENVKIDISSLKIGQSIHVRDINLGTAVIKDSPDEVIAVVSLAGKASAAPESEAPSA
jgi:large subunit ribosomal protein L25